MDSIETSSKIFIEMLKHIQNTNPLIAWAIRTEIEKQQKSINLIASENYTSLSVAFALSSLLTFKYAEGFPGNRFYGGCDIIDVLEKETIRLAKEVFGAEEAFVQPESGSIANLIAYRAILHQHISVPFCQSKGVKTLDSLSRQDFEELRVLLGKQKLCALHIDDGGHITHGLRMNFSGQMFDCYFFPTNQHNQIDYEALDTLVGNIKPLIILAGSTSYTRHIDFKLIGHIANKHKAIFIADISHTAGLIAAKVVPEQCNPIPYADIVTTTTHKTLRGPRGAIILCKQKYLSAINKACPLTIGGPAINTIAAKAIALSEALTPEFKTYASQIIINAQAMAQKMLDRGLSLVYNGTDTHVILIDLSTMEISGLEAEIKLHTFGIVCNRNTIPNDKRNKRETSGIRIGLAAITTRGFMEDDAIEVADIICDILIEKAELKDIIPRIHNLISKYPLYKDLQFVDEEKLSLFAVNP